MPEATIVPPRPSAAPKPGAPSAFPASTGEINVPGTVHAATATNPHPPESAKGKMFEELGKRAGAQPGSKPAEKPAAAKPATKPAETAAPKPAEAEAPKPGESTEQPAEEAQPTEEGAAVQPAEGKELKKGSPWKLVKDYKARVATLESEVLELKKGGVKPEERKAIEERATKAEARAKELEQYLTYVDYSQTEDFKNTYVQPYEKAWHQAMDELRELTVPVEGGGERAINAQDMLAIVNAPLAKARQMAEEVFGNFANDVMAHRATIKGLYDKQAAALEDAKKNGTEKLAKAREEQAKMQEAITQTVQEMWTKENEAIKTNEKYKAYFSPKDGDEEWNARLTKGYELADKAFSENPSNPKLTAEQRAEAIKRHAAVRNRAASWGALRLQVERQAKQLQELQEKLSQYEGTEPGLNGDRKPGEAVSPGSGNAKANMLAELRKRAK